MAKQEQPPTPARGGPAAPPSANIHSAAQSQSQPALGGTATDAAFASGEAGAAAATGVGVVRVRAPGGPPASYAGFSPHRATKESEGPTSCPHSTLLQSGIEWVKNAV